MLEKLVLFFQPDILRWRQYLFVENDSAQKSLHKVATALAWGRKVSTHGQAIDQSIPLAWYLSHGNQINFDLSKLRPEEKEIFCRLLKLPSHFSSNHFFKSRSKLEILDASTRVLFQSKNKGNQIVVSVRENSSVQTIKDIAYATQFKENLGYAPSRIKEEHITVQVDSALLALLQSTTITERDLEIAPLSAEEIKASTRGDRDEAFNQYAKTLKGQKGDSAILEIDEDLTALKEREHRNLHQMANDFYFNQKNVIEETCRTYQTSIKEDKANEQLTTSIGEVNVAFKGNAIQLENLSDDAASTDTIRAIQFAIENLIRIKSTAAPTADNPFYIRITTDNPVVRTMIEKVCAEKNVVIVTEAHLKKEIKDDISYKEPEEEGIGVEDIADSIVEPFLDFNIDDDINRRDENFKVHAEYINKAEIWLKAFDIWSNTPKRNNNLVHLFVLFQKQIKEINADNKSEMEHAFQAFCIKSSMVMKKNPKDNIAPYHLTKEELEGMLEGNNPRSLKQIKENLFSNWQEFVKQSKILTDLFLNKDAIKNASAGNEINDIMAAVKDKDEKTKKLLFLFAQLIDLLSENKHKESTTLSSVQETFVKSLTLLIQYHLGLIPCFKSEDPKITMHATAMEIFYQQTENYPDYQNPEEAKFKNILKIVSNDPLKKLSSLQEHTYQTELKLETQNLLHDSIINPQVLEIIWKRGKDLPDDQKRELIHQLNHALFTQVADIALIFKNKDISISVSEANQIAQSNHDILKALLSNKCNLNLLAKIYEFCLKKEDSTHPIIIKVKDFPFHELASLQKKQEALNVSLLRIK